MELGLWDSFKLAIMPESEAEKEVNSLYGPQPTQTDGTSKLVASVKTAVTATDTWLSDVLTPESHSENVVNQIYNSEGRGMLGLPGQLPAPRYSPAMARAPAAIMSLVETGQEVIGFFKGEAQKYVLWAFAGLLILIAVNALLPVFIRR